MVCESLDGNVEPVVEKSFLIPQTTSGSPGPAWTLHALVASESPDVGSLLGAEWTGTVHFVIQEDRLQLVRAVKGKPREVTDSWLISNVGASPGCILNMNDEWQIRDWVEVTFTKTDPSDLAFFQPGDASTVDACIESAKDLSTSLVPGSFGESEAAGTLQWSIAITGTLSCAAYAGTTWSAQVDYAFTRQ